MVNRKKPKVTKDDIWSAVAVVLGAERVMDRKGRHIKQLRLNPDPWRIVLDTLTESTGQSAQTYTRYRGLYTSRDDFRFRAYRKSVFSELGKFLGMQDIVVGHPKVDDDWIIKSNSEGKVRSVMILPGVIDCLPNVKSGRFETRRYRRSAPGVLELRLTILGVSTDANLLKAGFVLMADALNQLVRMGSGAPVGPELELK